MGEVYCDPDWDEPFCSGGIKYCCKSYQGGYDFRPCGTCGTTYRLSINVPSTFHAGQSVTVTGQLLNGTTPVPNVAVTVWFGRDIASWEGRLGQLGGTATTNANGIYSVTLPAWRFMLSTDTRAMPRGWSYKATCANAQSEVVLNMQQGIMVDTVLDIVSITPEQPSIIESVTVVGTLDTTSGIPLSNVLVHTLLLGPADSGPAPFLDVRTDEDGMWVIIIPASKLQSEPAGNWNVGAYTDSFAVSTTLYMGTVMPITDHFFAVLCYSEMGIPEAECESIPQDYSPDQGEVLCDGDGRHYTLQQTDQCRYCYVWDGIYCGTGCVPGATRPCSGGIGQEVCKVVGNETVWDASGCYHSSCIEGAKRGMRTCTNGLKVYSEVCHNDAWVAIFPPETCPPVCIPGTFDPSAATLCPDLVTVQNHKVCAASTMGNQWIPYIPEPCPACGQTHPTPACEDDGYVYDCVNEIWKKTTTPCCKTTHPTPECISGQIHDCSGEEFLPTGEPCGEIPCSSLKPQDCIDGHIWACIDGEWKDTGAACGPNPPDNTMLIVLVGGLAIAGAGVAVWMLRKPRAK